MQNVTIICGVIAAISVAATTTLAVSPAAAGGGLVTDATGSSAGELAASLAGPGIEILGATMLGDPQALGTFSGMSTMGIDEGVALSTGRVVGLPGVHTDDRSGYLGTPGDDDIEASIGLNTFDAAVLEFDFTPRADSVSFTYVFASEEYPDWIGLVNDSFRFFINGTNCAVIGDTPVSVVSVNHKVNTAFYIANNATTPRDGTAFNGFTTPLTCEAAVNKGEVNHAKLVIADARDHSLDSTVLISAGSVRSNTPPTAADVALTVVQGESGEVVYPGADGDGDPLTYTVLDPPAHGTLVSGPTGVVYTAPADFSGLVTYTYTVSDGVDVSPPYTVTVLVTAPVAPETPVLSALDAHHSIVRGAAVPITLAATPHDPAASTTFEIVQPPVAGFLVVEGGSHLYQSAADFTGTVSFRYTATRSGVTSAPGTVTIDIVDPPADAGGAGVADRSDRDRSAEGKTAAAAGSTALATTGTDARWAVAVGAATLALGVVLGIGGVLRRSRRLDG
ncbi:choice-of-anchor L domain-containing protein [Leifsonia sp. 21MFCrub1.1]|uniref:choice-of-anchor L domain-containing protein n=1 Tax=Leifsonia sp. 21MFCrub1.1 TaxID=1798223 RepID=UPI0008929DD9|nr:choice-of-anchor L domain-containing protein [Leifsonia sp. 21MFCrub1.1]SEA55821.1 hypothetical protein SAMN04515680_0729 [Leifsonia sp. 21MFCrub1.1]